VSTTTTGATRALETVLGAIDAAGIVATRDAGSFHPRPVGVLVGLPSLAFRLLASRTYTIPVRVVSADPLNSDSAVDRLYALADELVTVLQADSYDPTDWIGGVNLDPLPCLLLTVTVTVEG